MVFSATLPQLLPAMFSTSLGLLLPSLIVSFHLTSLLAGLVVSITSLAATVSVALSGMAVSRLGERRVLLLGMASFVISLLAAASSQSTLLLLSAFGMTGLGGGLMITPCYSMIAKLLPEKGVGAGLVGAAFSVGSVVGPAMAGYLVVVAGWRLPLLVLSSIGGAALVMFFLGTRAFAFVKQTEGGRSVGLGLRSLLNGNLLMVGVAMLLGDLAAAAYTAWTPDFVIAKFGLAESSLSFLGTVIGAGLGLGGIGGILGGRLYDRLGGRSTSIGIGIAASLLTGALYLAGSLESTLLLAVGFGFLLNWYWVVLTAMSQLNRPVLLQPMAIGLVQTMALVGSAFGPALVGYLAGGTSPSDLAMIFGTTVPYLVFLFLFVAAYRGKAQARPKGGAVSRNPSSPPPG